MKEIIDIKQDRDRKNIDVGGTPAKIIEKGKKRLLDNCQIPSKQRIFVLDPFDLSRAERTITLIEKPTPRRIKIPLKSYLPVETSSDYSERPNVEDLITRFEENRTQFIDSLYQQRNLKTNKKETHERYDQFLSGLDGKRESIKSLRDLMDLIILKLDDLNTNHQRLERILEKHPGLLPSILEYQNVKTRIFCPECQKITSRELRGDEQNPLCCTTTFDSFLRSGRYIPEGPVLTAILFCAGINPLINKNSPYLGKTIDILKKLGKLDRPMLVYDEEQVPTMVESYLMESPTNET
jgi:hypothetical protein